MYADDADSPDSVEKYRENDHAMNGALEEAQKKRPSISGLILQTSQAIDFDPTFELSF